MAYKFWVCVKCGQEVLSPERPVFKWTDGHVCYFEEDHRSRATVCVEKLKTEIKGGGISSGSFSGRR